MNLKFLPNFDLDFEKLYYFCGLKNERTMESLFEQLKEYLATATKEQLDADWEKLKKYNEIGPLVEDVLGYEVLPYKNEQIKQVVADVSPYTDENFILAT